MQICTCTHIDDRVASYLAFCNKLSFSGNGHRHPTGHLLNRIVMVESESEQSVDNHAGVGLSKRNNIEHLNCTKFFETEFKFYTFRIIVVTNVLCYIIIISTSVVMCLTTRFSKSGPTIIDRSQSTRIQPNY